MAKKIRKSPKLDLSKLFPKKDKRKKAREKRQSRRQKRLQSGLSKALQQYKSPKIELEPKTHTNLHNEISDTLDYIRSNKDLNRDQQLSMYLSLALRNEIGDMSHQFKPGEDNDYFKIDDDWDGDLNGLISNVTIKQNFNNPTARDYLKEITDSKWGSEEQHEKYLEDARHQAYEKLTQDLDVDVSRDMIDVLEDIMNSSEMWHTVADQYGLGTKSYDSDQAKEEWDRTYRNVQKILKADKGTKVRDIERLTQKLLNYDISGAVEFVNKTLEGYR